MSAPAAAVARARAAQRTSRFRTDVQALRAVAIGLVVLNHLWPGRVPGGYVGVDVFFVISGFLITGHLLAELERTGRVALGAFYARRIRRLLPAALLVLALTLGGVWALLPYTRWADNALQAVASAFYVENWALAGLSVNYSAHNAAASAVQHYWSLSVEEQFYLLWPLLLLGAALLALRAVRGRRARTRVILTAVAAIALLSLAASVVFTAYAPSQSYFVTFTRVWQFAVGAMIAILPAAVFGRMPPAAASGLAAAGFAGIAAGALLYGAETPYPGVAALLPVVSTAAVIAAGAGRGALLPLVSRLTDARPVQWLGDVSYSLYLVHWPLIVLTPFLLGAPLAWHSRLGILVVALALAWLIRRGVEVPAQRASWWKRAPRAFIGAAAMMAVVATIAAALGGAASARTDAAEDPRPLTGECAGAAALLDTSRCDPSAPVGDAVVTASDVYFALAPECADLDGRLVIDDKRTTRECDFSRSADAPRVWLVGDSHAEQWQAAVFPIAREEGWRLTISSFPGCPPADVAFVGFDAPWGPVDYERCRSWAEALSDELIAERPDAVITSMAARQQLVDDGTGRPHDVQFVEGLQRTWGRWTAAGINVVPIADTPLNGDVRDPDCLLLSHRTPASCAVPRAVAMPPDPVAQASAARAEGVWPVDLTSSLCDEAVCFAAVGGEPVFYDADHLSRAYAETLSGRLKEALPPALMADSGGTR
ncbi:acyltransferase family protein [Microbacterium sp. XT11]|uniref:acyltransferase family protein n=1 Tax=Microbacterium sp. XT11 TaxID=367477 RepID=UPI00083486CB|nr:acyltransferase family protein [Microbacterium sp. XT11]